MGLGVYILAPILSSFAILSHATVSCSKCRRICWCCYSSGLHCLSLVGFNVCRHYDYLYPHYGRESIMFRSVTAAHESGRSGSRIWGQSTEPTMQIDPTDYLATLNTYQDPANGTVSWYLAQICADLMGLSGLFSGLYGPLRGQRVDFGEFAAWAIGSLDG